MAQSNVTAGIVLIGDELLSGRTRDINLQTIAHFLAPLGIQVQETRIVRDDQDAIVEALNALRVRYSYVFTTGGIGPTHDDITADAIAAAFGVTIGENAEAVAILEQRYRETGVALTPARRRMARIPEGGQLICNPVSGAPGFQLGNVFTLAGVPSIARAMLEDVAPRLTKGKVVHSATVRGRGAREGDLAEALGDLAKAMPAVSFGSYPWYISGDYGVHLVARTTDKARLETAHKKLRDILSAAGGTEDVTERA